MIGERTKFMIKGGYVTVTDNIGTPARITKALYGPGYKQRISEGADRKYLIPGTTTYVNTDGANFEQKVISAEISRIRRRDGAKRIIKRAVLSKPWTMKTVRITKWTVEGGEGTVVYTSDFYGTVKTIVGNIGHFNWVAIDPMQDNFALPLDIANMKANSVQNAYAKLNESDIDIGLILGELKETLHLMRSPCSAIVKLAQSMYRDAWKVTRATRYGPRGRRSTGIKDAVVLLSRGKRLVDALSNQWLEYRLGMIPLLSDLEDAQKALIFGLDKLQAVMRTKRGTVKIKQENLVCQSGSNYPEIGYTMFWSGLASCEHKCTTKVYYFDRPFMQDAKTLQNMGLSPTQLTTLVWNLIPLSFVVDRFYRVGKWLDAISPHPTLDVVGSCTTYKKTYKAVVKLVSGYGSSVGIPGTNKVTPLEFTCEEIVRSLDEPLSYGPVRTATGTTLMQDIDHLALIWGRLPKILTNINLFNRK